MEKDDICPERFAEKFSRRVYWASTGTLTHTLWVICKINETRETDDRSLAQL